TVYMFYQPNRLTTMSDEMYIDIHTEEQCRIALGQSRLTLASAEARDVLRHLPTNELEYWHQQYEGLQYLRLLPYYSA
ncbi:hypothetical protein KEM55_005294, partial [Ascosphaera atra]